jgi:hypothetical protein
MKRFTFAISFLTKREKDVRVFIAFQVLGNLIKLRAEG